MAAPLLVEYLSEPPAAGPFIKSYPTHRKEVKKMRPDPDTLGRDRLVAMLRNEHRPDIAGGRPPWRPVSGRLDPLTLGRSLSVCYRSSATFFRATSPWAGVQPYMMVPSFISSRPLTDVGGDADPGCRSSCALRGRFERRSRSFPRYAVAAFVSSSREPALFAVGSITSGQVSGGSLNAPGIPNPLWRSGQRSMPCRASCGLLPSCSTGP